MIDGELVALDNDGVSHFQLLQNAFVMRRSSSTAYSISCSRMERTCEDFSLLQRKERLQAILPRYKLISVQSSSKDFWDEVLRRSGGTGSRRHYGQAYLTSTYLSGGRTSEWLKIKTAKRQEAVIAGFTAPKRSRPFFGALVLAVREKNRGVTSDMSARASLTRLWANCTASSLPLKTAKSPFPAKVKDQAVTTWIKPSLVAEVKFTEWTIAGEMRHPVYLGLRADKRAVDVVRRTGNSDPSKVDISVRQRAGRKNPIS